MKLTIDKEKFSANTKGKFKKKSEYLAVAVGLIFIFAFIFTIVNFVNIGDHPDKNDLYGGGSSNNSSSGFIANGGTITGYVGNKKDIVIPSIYNGYRITSIGNYAFSGCSGLKSITIPDSVTSIGYGAFYECIGLTSITIPDSVTSIGSYAFYGCSKLTRITFADTTTWYRTYNSTNWRNKTGGTQTSVTNASFNATNFKSTYYDYYWYKL